MAVSCSRLAVYVFLVFEAHHEGGELRFARIVPGHGQSQLPFLDGVTGSSAAWPKSSEYARDPGRNAEACPVVRFHIAVATRFGRVSRGGI